MDENYVGIPPPREVTFVNLNDNINSDFLLSMVKDLGRIDECSICYNPQNGKHLGIAKVGWIYVMTISIFYKVYSKHNNLILSVYYISCSHVICFIVS